MSRRYLLAADVGGTKTAVALAARGDPWPDIITSHKYLNREFGSLTGVVADFLARNTNMAEGAAIGAACFAVAGPVAGNACALTNVDWKIDGAALAREFGLPAVRLINDFVAAGQGIACLGNDDIVTLQAGTPVVRGSRLVVGAGTGLGVSVLTWEGGQYFAHPSEAGHADFAPVDGLQDRLLVHLRRQFGQVPYESVVSGPGLTRIFGFFQETGAGAPSQRLQEILKAGADTAEAITELAAASLDPLAMRALDLFVAVYGAFAGNLALSVLAHGGVYVAGGIGPKIVAKLRDGTFMRAFVNKEGQYRKLLETIPVRVVMNPQLGLRGALMEAQRLVNRDTKG